MNSINNNSTFNDKPHLQTNSARNSQARRVARILVLPLLWLSLALNAPAGSPYAGIYTGTLGGAPGFFAMFVETNGVGAMLGYGFQVYYGPSPGGLYQDYFMVAADGTFSLNNPMSTGAFTNNNVTGTYYDPGNQMTFTGTKRAAAGAQQANAGYYEGTITGGDAGPFRAVLAADGTIACLAVGTNNGYPAVNAGGMVSVDAAGHFSITSSNNLAIAGNVNSSTHSLSGTWSLASSTGTFTAQRRVPPATCTYALTPAGTNLAASDNMIKTFQVSAPAGCGWTATANQSWIQCYVNGPSIGSGTVSYSLTPNGSDNFRIGTITVGDQVFTITQGPQGYVWHRIFGWLYDANGNWYWSPGFAWMWFSEGPWIYSTSLQGWLADMGTSRTMWSPQFRWVTPSDSNPYRAETTSLGTIYVGQYLETAIPAGFAASERFGYIWPAGDGVWFYSSTYQWLGVTPDGGIWCVSQNRWL